MSSAYYGGWLDTILRGIVDVGLTIPGLMVLIVIAMMIPSGLTVNQMALVVALLAWLVPARTIRAQVLSLRERSYVQVAQLSGMPGHAIIFKEIMPNLLPYLAASLVVAVSAAVLASIGLEVLGLGPMDAPTIGMTLFWINYNAAVINGWWWWWLPPIIFIAILFISLFMIAQGLDEVANPRHEEIGLMATITPTIQRRLHPSPMTGASMCCALKTSPSITTPHAALFTRSRMSPSHSMKMSGWAWPASPARGNPAWR